MRDSLYLGIIHCMVLNTIQTATISLTRALGVMAFAVEEEDSTTEMVQLSMKESG